MTWPTLATMAPWNDQRGSSLEASNAKRIPGQTIFDIATQGRSETGTRGSLPVFGIFRCTDRDKAPAREVVTARLMGDPAPDRPRPSEPMPDRICTESGPVLLTFNELAAATGRA